MPVTALDPKTALITIDLQKGIVGLLTAHSAGPSILVESTARQAHEHGFHVTLTVDAIAEMNTDAHNNSITRIFLRLEETGTTDEIIQLIEKRREKR